MIYNKENLYNYCENNNIKINYINEDTIINRETLITGNCIINSCNGIFNKKYRQLLLSGAYCKICTNKNSITKIKNKKVLYNKDYLIEYCKINSINIINEYDYVNRDTKNNI